MIRTHLICAALVAGLLAGCGGGEDAPAERQLSAIEAFPNIPLPPDGRMLGTEGSGEALQLLMSTPMATDSVTDYYRRILADAPYRLLNETSDSTTTSFYVESGEERPLWVRVERLAAGGTVVRLIGTGRPDGAAAPAAPAAPTDTTPVEADPAA